jgi:hypothetical protein
MASIRRTPPRRASEIALKNPIIDPPCVPPYTDKSGSSTSKGEVPYVIAIKWFTPSLTCRQIPSYRGKGGLGRDRFSDFSMVLSYILFY